MEVTNTDLFIFPTRWEIFNKTRTGMIGLSIVCVLMSLLLLGPLFSGYRYDEIHLAFKNHPPSWQFWFGTDDLGRDLFTRICYGGRISFAVGIGAAFIDLTLGILWGSLAGFSPRWLDEVMMRTLDILNCIPSLPIAILITVVFGSGFFSILLAISVICWIPMARIVRGQVLLLKEMDYVLAARSLGANSWRVLRRHILPNALGPIFVTVLMTIPTAIFNEAFLSYIGLGVQAPMSSWGTMAHEGLPAMVTYPWRLLFPSLFISLTLFSFYLIGEGLKRTFSQSQTLNQL